MSLIIPFRPSMFWNFNLGNLTKGLILVDLDCALVDFVFIICFTKFKGNFALHAE